MGVLLTDLPFHPITGLQAIGFAGSKPVWPVMGGSTPEPPPATPPAPTPPAGPPTPPPNADKGFPENTPIADMTVEQQLAYFKHHDRKKADTLSKFGGFTPEQVKQQAEDLEKLRQAQLTADQRAIEDAKTEAANAAKSEAAGTWAPKLLKAVASRFVEGDQLKSFLAVTDAKAFIKDGEFDDEAVVGHLTGLFGTANNTSGNQQQRQWGQGGGRPQAQSGRDQGLAEAKRRGYIKD
ncbi:hypothetical protein KXR83_05745 [Williamsia muralis]|uniref:hypothetical protein n=1 Tax=Williamsia marianensis TaxID=85044 RepID=UPI003F167A45